MDQTTDTLTLLRSLDANALKARLDALQAETDALRVLLRSARARERHRQEPPCPAREGSHAD